MPKRRANTEEEHREALAGDDPTQVPADQLEGLAREAVKKFKSQG